MWNETQAKQQSLAGKLEEEQKFIRDEGLLATRRVGDRRWNSGAAVFTHFTWHVESVPRRGEISNYFSGSFIAIK